MSYTDEGGDGFGPALMAKAAKIEALAVKQRAAEYNNQGGTLLNAQEELELYGSQTGGRTAPEVQPGSPHWSRLEEQYGWVSDVFKPFTEMPNPNAFTPLIRLADGVKAPLGMSEVDSRGKAALGDTALGGIGTAAITLGQWRGDGASSFANFSKPFSGIAHNQLAIADALSQGMRANREIFVKTRHSISSVADTTITALQNCGTYGFGANELVATVNVLAAVAAFAATAASGGATLPVVFAAIAGAGSTTGALVSYAQAEAGEKEPPISGYTVNEVLQSMQAAVTVVRRDISAAEETIAYILQQNLAVVLNARKVTPAEVADGKPQIVAPRPLLADLTADNAKTHMEPKP
ncbi:MAG: hypothetical protein ACRDT6_16740 [Micromonosporaceae bacterium]